MEIRIDFSKKDPGYREAMEKFMAKRPVPIYTEFKHPEFGNVFNEEKLKRMYVTVDERVCGKITDVKFEDSFALATVELAGPLQRLIETGDFSIGARMLTTCSGSRPTYVREITNFDILPAELHIDYQESVEHA